MITISKIAAEKVKGIIIKQKNPESTMVRITFEGYG
jgi:Fe-S cluster assembly iron-binding protein IscA